MADTSKATANGGSPIQLGPGPIALPWPAQPTSLALAAAEDCAAVDHIGRGRGCLHCGAVVEEPWANTEEADR